jgi:hypothetical protein
MPLEVVTTKGLICEHNVLGVPPDVGGIASPQCHGAATKVSPRSRAIAMGRRVLAHAQACQGTKAASFTCVSAVVAALLSSKGDE